MLIDDDRTDRGRCAVGAPGARGKTGHCLQEKVLTGAVAIRAIASETGRHRIDQPGIDRFQDLVTEAEFFHRAGTEILHHDICPLDQLLHGRDAVRVLQIDSDAAFVAAGREVVDTVAADEAVGDRPVPLESTLDRLNRNDIRTEIGKCLGGQRSRQEMVETEDFHAVQQGHYCRSRDMFRICTNLMHTRNLLFL